MAKRIFIWLAHPAADSFCAALADAYEKGAREAGAEIRRINLADMDFDADVSARYGADVAPLEPDLVDWQAAMHWAEHVLVVHPYWWGSMPGRAKVVLDRALVPGFGFKYRPRGLGWDRLLAGRTGDVLITADTPPLYDTFAYGRPGRRVMKNQVLEFCGIKVRKSQLLGSIRSSSAGQRAKWIAGAAAMGRSATGDKGMAVAARAFLAWLCDGTRGRWICRTTA